VTGAVTARLADRRRFAIGVGLVAAIGLVVRVAFVLLRQSRAVVGGDAFWYHVQGRLVADGRGFLHPYEWAQNGREVPGADHPPGMTVLVALADLAGIESPQGQRLLMAVLGTCTVALVSYAGRRIAAPWAAPGTAATVGLVAGLLAALYPNVWINDGMLMAETPFVFGIALLILCTYRYLDGHGVWDVVGITGGVTIAAMTRPETVVLFPFLVAPIVLTRWSRPRRERVAHFAVAVAVPVAAFTPWLAYNLSRFEAPVLLSTGAGQTFVVGNCPLTYDGDNLGYWDRNCLFPPYLDPPTEPDLSLRDGEYRAAAFSFVRDNAGSLPKVVAARVGRLWHLYRVDESIPADGFVEGRAGGAPGEGLGLAREALWSYYALVPFAIAGAVLLRRRRRQVFPLLAQVVLATFGAMISFGITRYRAGAELSIVLFAAVALVLFVRLLVPGWFDPDDQRAASAPPAEDAPPTDGSDGGVDGVAGGAGTASGVPDGATEAVPTVRS
jgi:4-amino-4-deoxy-L-arabinose transferase-like glycosyltransferase